MTTTRHFPARFAIATAAVVGLALVATGCSSSAKTATSTKTTTTNASLTAAFDSDYCKSAREWQVHELDGEGSDFAPDPAAFEKYWNDYMAFIATMKQHAPAELRDEWAVSHTFLVEEVTPLLKKYDYDVARIKSNGTPAELAVAKRVDEGPNPVEERAQDTEHEYEGRVCETAQPPAADVSFAAATPNKAYCDTVKAGDELVGEVSAKKWSVDAVRTFVTSDEFAALADKAKKNAPAEIKADVLADTDWQLNQQVDVIEKYGYDVRKLFREASAADLAIFQRSDPAIAQQYARTVAYEEQVCGDDS